MLQSSNLAKTISQKATVTMKTLKTLIPAIAVIIAILAAPSCKRDTDAKVIIRVVENTVDQLNTQDTIQTPVVQAEVRFYQDEKPGTQWLEETILTSTNGIAEFIFPNPAILKYDVTHSGRSKLENFVILEAGETVEVTVNLDED
jgi:hypothetical protein